MADFFIIAERRRVFDVLALRLFHYKQIDYCEQVVLAVGDGETKRVTCRDDRYGEAVKIQIMESQPETLALCEVKIHAYFGKSGLLGLSFDLTINI